MARPPEGECLVLRAPVKARGALRRSCPRSVYRIAGAGFDVLCSMLPKAGGVCRIPRNIYNMRVGSCRILQIFTTFMVTKSVVNDA